ncbi:MAG: lasso peptide biosynthesis B2 protein [Candidatus Promineifilaceae bacterium]
MRLHNLRLVLAVAPTLFVSRRRRWLLTEAGRFCRSLPARLREPLPQAIAGLTPPALGGRVGPAHEAAVRDLADLAALLDRRSPLGLCLRRSLTRYYFLRRAGVPVELQFGARLGDGRPERQLHGHAWLALDGQPYYEEDENWRGFKVMLAFPRDLTLPAELGA